MSDPIPFVSVVIPVLNEVDNVAPCIEALRAQDYPAERLEIRVADNGSTDGTQEALERLEVDYVHCPTRGRAHALNAALERARGEIVCTTDMSCRAAPDWISRVVADFADPRIGCVAGDIRMLDTNDDNAALRFQRRNHYMSPMWALTRRRPPFLPFADGANASFRREVFARIGPFEARFPKAADVEICYRMFVLSDYDLLFDWEAVLWEPAEPDLLSLLRQRMRMGLGWNLMVHKYPRLYAHSSPATPAGSLKNWYWGLRQQLAQINRLWGRSPEAEDARIRLLMGWVQAFSRYRTRKAVARMATPPEPVDDAAIQAFLKATPDIFSRVRVRGTPAFALPLSDQR